jgi:hypothetical protein
VDVKEGCIALLNTGSHRRFHSLEAIEIFCVPKVDDEVCSGKDFAVFTDEMIK